MTDESTPLSDAEARAADQARAGGDAIEHRAVSVGNIVRNRRAAPDADVPRAESRGIYRDLDNRRRVVGAGQPVPDGWERLESATVEDRVGAVETNQGDPDGEATATAGNSDTGKSAKRAPAKGAK